MAFDNDIGEKLKVIVYRPGIRKISGGVTSAIAMQQLEYWFAKSSSVKFYKFLSPAEGNVLYKTGDSWEEELGFTAHEFRGAFAKIGKPWGSKSEFNKASDKFKGKFYCSYVDKRRGLTFYLRNPKWGAIWEEKCSKLKEVRKIKPHRFFNLPTPEILISTDAESESLEIKKTGLLYTENTSVDYSEITQKKNKQKNLSELVVPVTNKSLNGLSASVCFSGEGNKNNLINKNASPNNNSNNLVSNKERFNAFWKLYPIKKSKQEALGFFKKLNPSEKLFNQILDAVKKQIEERNLRLQEGLFVSSWPMPVTWLNKRRWEDEVQSEGDIKLEGQQHNQSSAEKRALAIEKSNAELWANERAAEKQKFKEQGYSDEEIERYYDELEAELDKYF